MFAERLEEGPLADRSVGQRDVVDGELLALERVCLDIGGVDRRMGLADLGGGLTYPQILFGERVVNGWTELRELDRSGELERLAPTR